MRREIKRQKKKKSIVVSGVLFLICSLSPSHSLLAPTKQTKENTLNFLFGRVCIEQLCVCV